MTAILISERPRASREYACAECGEPIPKGETYECRRVRKGQTFTTVRLHFLCPPPKGFNPQRPHTPYSAPRKASAADWWTLTLCALAALIIAVVAVATLAGGH